MMTLVSRSYPKIEMEAGYDFVKVTTPEGEVIEKLTGSLLNYTSEYIKGDALVVRLESDSTVNKDGFKITKIQIIK